MILIKEEILRILQNPIVIDFKYFYKKKFNRWELIFLSFLIKKLKS